MSVVKNKDVPLCEQCQREKARARKQHLERKLEELAYQKKFQRAGAAKKKKADDPEAEMEKEEELLKDFTFKRKECLGC